MTDLIHDTINYLCEKIKSCKTADEKQALIAALDTLLDVYFDRGVHFPTPKIQKDPIPESNKIWVSDNTNTLTE